MPEFDAFVDGLTEITDPGASDNIPITRDGTPYRVKPTALAVTEDTVFDALLPIGELTDNLAPNGLTGFYSVTAGDGPNNGDEAWCALHVDDDVSYWHTGFGNNDRGVIAEVHADKAHLTVSCPAAQSLATPALSIKNVSADVLEVNKEGAIVTLKGVAVPITGVPVTAEGVHAALVTLGLITT